MVWSVSGFGAVCFWVWGGVDSAPGRCGVCSWTVRIVRRGLAGFDSVVGFSVNMVIGGVLAMQSKAKKKQFHTL